MPLCPQADLIRILSETYLPQCPVCSCLETKKNTLKNPLFSTMTLCQAIHCLHKQYSKNGQKRILQHREHYLRCPFLKALNTHRTIPKHGIENPCESQLAFIYSSIRCPYQSQGHFFFDQIISISMLISIKWLIGITLRFFISVGSETQGNN